MKKPWRWAQKWLLVVPTAIVGSLLTNSLPSNAATFAFSQADFQVNNVSSSINDIELINQGNVSGQTNGGIFGGQNNASNQYTTSPLEINSSAFSLAFGDNRDYAGTVQAQAQILGNFEVDAGQLFSFDFSASLGLETDIDDPLAEKANALGEILFYLFDTTNVSQNEIFDSFANVLANNSNLKYNPLDTFRLHGSLNTLGLPDFIDYQRSENIFFSNENKQFDFDGTEESASALVRGSLRRSFANKSNVTLLAMRRTQSAVQVPESSLLIALALLLLAMIVEVVPKGGRVNIIAQKSTDVER